jgi:NADPH:quinone reductase-like Zn-dependent oxidoreductase
MKNVGIDMRAYALTRYGDPRAMEMREVPEPSPGDGEVLVKVHAAGLNPVDYKLRQGKMRLVNRLALPLVAGSELAGVVAEVGPGISNFAVGEKVFARVDKHKLGAFAPYAVVSEAFLARMPESLDFVEAAGLPLAGLTALQALRDELSVCPGDRIFISGGAGGVGSLAIQLAVWMGAEVATTASAQSEKLLHSLGATTVINYREQKFKEVLREYDGALDLTGGPDLTDSFAIVKRGGKTVSIAGIPEPTPARVDLAAGPLLTAALWLASAGIRRQARRKGVGYRYMFMHPSGVDLELLAGLVDEGILKTVTDSVFPFEQIADGFAHLEEGHAKGKIVISM